MKIAEIDIRDKINDEIKVQGRKLTWLADTVEINYNTLYSIIVQKTITLTDETREKINDALGTDF